MEEEMTFQASTYEIERGKPLPSKNPGIIQLRLGTALLNQYESKFTLASEVSFDLSSGPRTPDLCLMPPAPVDWFNDEIKVSEPPLGVIEIQSPAQGTQDMIDKIGELFAAGVRSAWWLSRRLKRSM